MYIADLGMCNEPDCIEDAELQCPTCARSFCPACFPIHMCEKSEPDPNDQALRIAADCTVRRAGDVAGIL